MRIAKKIDLRKTFKRLLRTARPRQQRCVRGEFALSSPSPCGVFLCGILARCEQLAGWQTSGQEYQSRQTSRLRERLLTVVGDKMVHFI